MGSQRAGMIFGALSEGFGNLFNVAYQREQEEARQRFQMALEQLRAQREYDAETRRQDFQLGLEAERTEREATRTAAAERTATQRHEETIARFEAQSSQARTAQRENLAQRDEAALQKRLDSLYDQYQDALELAQERNPLEDPDPEQKLFRQYLDARDQAVAGFVRRMGEQGKIGYEGAMDSPEAFAGALMQWDVSAEAADYYAKQRFQLFEPISEVTEQPPLLSPSQRPAGTPDWLQPQQAPPMATQTAQTPAGQYQYQAPQYGPAPPPAPSVVPPQAGAAVPTAESMLGQGAQALYQQSPVLQRLTQRPPPRTVSMPPSEVDPRYRGRTY